MIEAGIVDPPEFVRTALVDVPGVVNLSTTSAAFVVDALEDNPARSAGIGGGMGGMADIFRF
jgi:hypothetical protein